MDYLYYLGKTTKAIFIETIKPKGNKRLSACAGWLNHQASFHLGHLEALRESVLSEHALQVWVRRRDCKSEG